MSDMNENVTKEVELIKKNQIEILEIKSSISEIKKIWFRALTAEYMKWRKDFDLKDKNFEITQSCKK